MVKIEKFLVGLLKTNCYLLFDEDKNAIVIDPGEKSEELAHFIHHRGIKVEKILLTHGHFDHFNGIAWLKQLTKACVAMSEKDLPVVREFSGFRAEFFGYKVVNFEPDLFLKEGDIIKIGEIELKVLETPGHSIGGLSFYLTKEKIIFTGDTLFAGSFGRIDLPTSSLRDLKESFKKLLTLPPDTKIYPGHGSFSTISQETKMIQELLT